MSIKKSSGWDSLLSYDLPDDGDELIEKLSQKPSQGKEDWDDFPSISILDDRSDLSDDDSDLDRDDSDIVNDFKDIPFDLTEGSPDWFLHDYGEIRLDQTWASYPDRRSTRHFMSYQYDEEDYFEKDVVDVGYSEKEIQESEKHRYELKKIHDKVKLQTNYYPKIRKALKSYVVGLSMEDIELVVEKKVLDRPLFIGNGTVEISEAAGTKYKKYFKKKEKGNVEPLEIYVKGQLTLKEFFEELISYRVYIEETHELKKNDPTDSPSIFYFGYQNILNIKSKGFLKAKTCGYNCVKLYISWVTIDLKKLLSSLPIDQINRDKLIQNGKVDESRYKYKKLHKKMNLMILTNPDILYTLNLYHSSMSMEELEKNIEDDFYTTPSILNIPLITGKGKLVLYEPYKYNKHLYHLSEEYKSKPLEIFIDGKLTFREFFEILIDNSPKLTISKKPYFVTSLLTRGLFRTKECGYNCVQMKLKWSQRSTPLLDKLRKLIKDCITIEPSCIFIHGFMILTIMITVIYVAIPAVMILILVISHAPALPLLLL